MSGQDVLKQFVVALGWQNDEVAARKAIESVAKIEKGLASLVLGAEAAALGVVAALGKAAQSFERLYYASERTGSSAQNLRAFGYAIGQVGGNADEAIASVESLARKIRESPGFGTMLKQKFGIDPRDAEKATVELGRAFAKMPYYQARQFAEMLGIDERTLLAMTKHGPEVERFMADYAARADAMGVNLKQAAEDGKNLTQRLREVRSSLDLIIDAADSPLFKELDEPLRQLNQFLVEHGREIAEIIGKIAAAFLQIFTETMKLLPEVDKLVEGIGGWKVAFEGLAAVVTVALVGRIASLFGSLRGLSLLAMPPWLLALLGVGAAAPHIEHALRGPVDRAFDALTGPATPEQQANRDMSVWDRAKRIWRRATGGGPEPINGNQALRWRGRNARGGGAGTAAVPPTTPGTYRPVYHLGEHDMSDSVVNVIAGEAVASDPNSVDAVINNMLNRVGTRTYGPSGNLEEVALAPGQYAASPNRRASAKVAALIRDRIRAIASGGVSDNTGGSNEYRAGTYRGPWYQHHSDAPVVGGNRFAYNPSGGLGLYSPYPVPKLNKLPPMMRSPTAGAATPHQPAPMIPFNPNVSAPPLGSQSNDNSKSVTVIDQSKTTVNGVSDPQKAADHIGRIGDRQSSLLLRNLQSAVG